MCLNEFFFLAWNMYTLLKSQFLFLKTKSRCIKMDLEIILMNYKQPSNEFYLDLY